MGVTESKYKISPEPSDCAICFNKCKHQVLTPCSHTFCLECIKKWIRVCEIQHNLYRKNITSHCPLCRFNFNKHKLVVRYDWYNNIKSISFKQR